MRKIISLVGPTAVGKTGLALRIATDINAEIINADALQAYRGFDIGTAKPSESEQALVPHHLIDILDSDQSYSAGTFARLAHQHIEEIHARGRRVMVVGGSGLYQRALLWGIATLPERNLVIHADLVEELEKRGIEWARQTLRDIDPSSAARIAPNDMQRTMRALEVYESTGRPLSEHLADQPFEQGSVASIRIGLTAPRAVLYDRIGSRITQMIEAGWVAEVAAIVAAGISTDAPAFQAIGYRQIAKYLDKTSTLDEALGDTIRATRRYAKRQLTWFRKEQDVAWFSPLDPSDQTSNFSAIMAHIRAADRHPATP